jgi:hypothetical protein
LGVTDELRAMFTGRTFGPPCAEADIQRAEAALGEPLPPALRELYLAFDGFRGSTDASFLWPLFAEEGLVAMNQFFRGDALFPQELVLRCLFFGDNGCGPQWGFKSDLPGQVIRWSAAWGEEFEVVGTNLLDVWRVEKQSYDSIGSET